MALNGRWIPLRSGSFWLDPAGTRINFHACLAACIRCASRSESEARKFHGHTIPKGSYSFVGSARNQRVLTRLCYFATGYITNATPLFFFTLLIITDLSMLHFPLALCSCTSGLLLGQLGRSDLDSITRVCVPYDGYL
jgi:hypothetical protein